NGEQADVSVVPLMGAAGGDLANINRWRGQISLAPINEGDLAKASERVSLAGRPMLLIDFSNEGKRVIAATDHQDERSWFFKMTGDASVVAAEKPKFLKFLESVKFHAHE